MTDSELVRSALQGDESAFELIMRRNNQRLFRTARSILSTDADAEEVVQDAYLKAWQALARFRFESQLSTWLIRIVTNEALGRLRRKSTPTVPLETAMYTSSIDERQRLSNDESESPDRTVMRAQLRTLLEAHIDQLPDLYRTVFVLRAIEEMSSAEVALALQMPEATVRTRFFRARTLLRQSIVAEIDLTLSEVFSFDGKRCDRIVNTVLDKAGFKRKEV